MIKMMYTIPLYNLEYLLYSVKGYIIVTRLFCRGRPNLICTPSPDWYIRCLNMIWELASLFVCHCSRNQGLLSALPGQNFMQLFSVFSVGDLVVPWHDYPIWDIHVGLITGPSLFDTLQICNHYEAIYKSSHTL